MFPYQGKIDWEEVCRALGEMDYQGCFTYEADAGYMNLPPELLPAALEMLCKVGRHLISRIDYYRVNH
jgi:sugar phosphate isomerase/epimerase